ncbi:GGDEF domain-containing protein [Candidatus Woesearchaeota archaeon]|jgi:diguanylate cyclase (GGDEF)-like protein|nr:GGDEF domain-containing protein [Candidatus Woesearchaeota archaeon]MBT5272939.1 GGDEF domain-containing protein [Candidatus Woesearchaeota archaeon]MBT6041405.1 GGDEF domain-containing protein [Candidatus Woesearchaeota archaeon]MBT6337288.1 GGDEF domain-containing protein [Candidatus Woesearchaeota archaeon]MBT7927165.1 GGDEF domain-containing protein [Candidatus Woesearchaeota archaeon]
MVSGNGDSESVHLRGKEVVDKHSFRREEDKVLSALEDKLDDTTDIFESLDLVLGALEEVGYVYPRIYRHRHENDMCMLVISRGLPESLTQGRTSFEVSRNIILEETVLEDQVYVNTDVFSDPDLILGEKDPLFHIEKQGTNGVEGIVCLKYERRSQIYHNPIKGVIVANFDPKKKTVDDREELFLHYLANIVSRSVKGLLELRENKKIIDKEKAARKELEEANRQLRLKVMQDGYTGLFNKETFHRHMPISLGNAKRNGNTSYLLLIDLDNFKKFNDTYGHPVGDEMILEVGKVLKEVGKVYNKQEDDQSWRLSFYRNGGDEFTGVYRTENKDAAIELAETIRTRISGIRVSNLEATMTASVGIAPSQPNYTDWHKEWYKCADSALYICKNRGRDTVSYLEK